VPERPAGERAEDRAMDISILPGLGLVALVVAMIVTLYDMSASLRPVSCPECPHCQQIAAEDALKQEQLAREYARRNHLPDPDDDDRRRL
jgi:hypothetical protein